MLLKSSVAAGASTGRPLRRRLVAESEESSLVTAAAQGTVTEVLVGRNGAKGLVPETARKAV